MGCALLFLQKKDIMKTMAFIELICLEEDVDDTTSIFKGTIVRDCERKL